MDGLYERLRLRARDKKYVVRARAGAERSHHHMHYKKGAKVLIIRNILTENMYHDHNYLTICISFDKIKFHLSKSKFRVIANELMNAARRGD